MATAAPSVIAVRAVASMRRPPAGTPATTLTLDPLNIPRAGARASSRLVRVRAGPYADEPFIYEFKVGVAGLSAARSRARQARRRDHAQPALAHARDLPLRHLVQRGDRRPAVHAAARAGAPPVST